MLSLGRSERYLLGMLHAIGLQHHHQLTGNRKYERLSLMQSSSVDACMTAEPGGTATQS